MADLKRLLPVLLIALLLAPAVLLAQDDDSEEGDAEPVTEVSDVIVVTASRTEQSLHEVTLGFQRCHVGRLDLVAADRSFLVCMSRHTYGPSGLWSDPRRVPSPSSWARIGAM